MGNSSSSVDSKTVNNLIAVLSDSHKKKAAIDSALREYHKYMISQTDDGAIIPKWFCDSLLLMTSLTLVAALVYFFVHTNNLRREVASLRDDMILDRQERRVG